MLNKARGSNYESHYTYGLRGLVEVLGCYAAPADPLHVSHLPTCMQAGTMALANGHVDALHSQGRPSCARAALARARGQRAASTGLTSSTLEDVLCRSY